MAVTIRNLTPRPIYVPLHSGENLRLPPGGTSGSVDEVEVKGNATLEKLLKQRMIAVESADAASGGAKVEAAAADGDTADSETRSRTRKKPEPAS
jgi:hypothetical protein